MTSLECTNHPKVGEHNMDERFWNIGPPSRIDLMDGCATRSGIYKSVQVALSDTSYGVGWIISLRMGPVGSYAGIYRRLHFVNILLVTAHGRVSFIVARLNSEIGIPINQ